MITYKKGNIFASKASALVCPVNCKGVMGAGLARQVLSRYPKESHYYINESVKGDIKIGGFMLCATAFEDKRTIVFFPTKDDWKKDSTLEIVEIGLKEFNKRIKEHVFFPSVAFPLLGCGCGGLSKKDVIPLMEKYLSDLPIEVEIWQLWN